MRYGSAQLCNQPITSEELKRLAVVHDLVCRQAGVPRHDPMAERIAAMAIRFYQLGMRDEERLIRTVSQSYRQLSAAASPLAAGLPSEGAALP